MRVAGHCDDDQLDESTGICEITGESCEEEDCEAFVEDDSALMFDDDWDNEEDDDDPY